MRKNILSRLFVVYCLLLVFGCKAKKHLVVNQPQAAMENKAPSETAEMLKRVRSAQLSFNTFSGKAKAKLNVNGSTNDVTLNIRINRGQKIWVSITAIAGIEVARALITPDSLLVINKIQGVYLRKPFNYIYKYASSQLDYHSIEALLVGNAIPQLLNDNAQLQADTSSMVFSGNLNELVYKLTESHDLHTRATNLSNPNAGQSLQVDNSAFIQAANKQIPSQIDISSAAGTKKVQISLHYFKVDFDQPLQYPFSIPSSYTAAK
ncbi:MAG: DUF4292 domain-containing protein [Mucilaginibacter sp.]|jgi:hypothetical protein